MTDKISGMPDSPVDKSNLQPTFVALADNRKNAITAESLTTFYKRNQPKSYSFDGSRAISKLLQESGDSSIEGLTSLSSEQFSLAINNIMKKVENHGEKQKILFEITQHAIKVLKRNPRDIVKILGLPYDTTDDELTAILS